jgi:hypothetical protein
VGAAVALLVAAFDLGPEVATPLASFAGALLALWRSAAPMCTCGRRVHKSHPKGKGTIAAVAFLGALATVLFLTLATLAATGCGTVAVQADRTVEFDIDAATCATRIRADGKLVFTLTTGPGVVCAIERAK